jgi:hypothetical protein
MRPRSLGLSLALILLTILAGLAVRFAHLGLPAPVGKYGGSALWALMVYWIVPTLLPRLPIDKAALVAALLATAVECVKLYHAPALDAFRLTLPGILLLGRFFSWWDLVAYWLAIFLGSICDRGLRPPTLETGSRNPDAL